MDDSEQEQERTQAATPHKLREAQKRGQVAKSIETNFAAVMAALVIVCFAAGPGIARRELSIARSTLSNAGRTDWSTQSVADWLGRAHSPRIQDLVPPPLAVALAAIVSNVPQVGGIFSFEPLTPDFDKINPAHGIRRFLSLRSLYDALRCVAKLTALGLVAWLAVRQLLPDLL